MDEYKKTAIKIFRWLSVFIVVLGLVMVLLDKHADGIVGQRKGSVGRFVSFNGWQICFLGALLLVIGHLTEKELRKKDRL